MAPLRILELELHVKLHTAGRQGRHRVSEKWGCDDSYITHIVDVIKHVERVQRHGQSACLFAGFRKHKVMRNVKVQFDFSWPREGIAQHPGRTIVHDAV